MSGKKFNIFLPYQSENKNVVKELYSKLTDSEFNYKVLLDDF